MFCVTVMWHWLDIIYLTQNRARCRGSQCRCLYQWPHVPFHSSSLSPLCFLLPFSCDRACAHVCRRTNMAHQRLTSYMSSFAPIALETHPSSMFTHLSTQHLSLHSSPAVDLFSMFNCLFACCSPPRLHAYSPVVLPLTSLWPPRQAHLLNRGQCLRGGARSQRVLSLCHDFAIVTMGQV